MLESRWREVLTAFLDHPEVSATPAADAPALSAPVAGAEQTEGA